MSEQRPDQSEDVPAITSEEVPWTEDTEPYRDEGDEPSSADVVDPAYERDDLGGA